VPAEPAPQDARGDLERLHPVDRHDRCRCG
jgi:hypothetical protein